MGDVVFTLRYRNSEPIIVTSGIIHELDGPIALESGFEVTYDGEWVKVTNKTIYGEVEPGLTSHGLCGNYDNDINNDYLDKSGNCVTDAADFADSWQASCPVRPYWSTYSIIGADERHVTFTNNHRETITLYWISVDGSWEKMADIEANESETVSKTYSHV